MSNEKKNVFYTIGEEIFNSVSHGIGAALAVSALVLMLVFSVFLHDPWKVVSSAIYGAAMIILYTMSTLYHSLTNKSAKRVFRIFDHCTIFLLIAGTYTPYTLVTLRGVLGWVLFGIVWGFTILGIILNSINLEKFKAFSMISYIAMGWVIIFAIKPLTASLPFNGIILLFAGGVAYMLGIIFYALKRVKYMHSIWHLFVLAGSILHFFSILLYVIL